MVPLMNNLLEKHRSSLQQLNTWKYTKIKECAVSNEMKIRSAKKQGRVISACECGNFIFWRKSLNSSPYFTRAALSLLFAGWLLMFRRLLYFLAAIKHTL
jgi:hypothetical protein